MYIIYNNTNFSFISISGFMISQQINFVVDYLKKQYNIGSSVYIILYF